MKIGVLGAGHLGRFHLQQIKEISELELVGFFEPNKEQADKMAKELNTTAFNSINELIDNVDIVDIVTPTLAHYDCAKAALKKSKHVFIEKPITNTVAEAKDLIKLAHEANVKVQVGHIERFNPAFRAVADELNKVRFIEAHRLSEFNPRGTDVSVVLDLMIHDIDIVLSAVKSSVRRISASGVSVISDTPDITNARIEFDNGCVANLTASRISLKNMRKARFFQQDSYITVDFFEKKSSLFKMKDVDENTSPFSMTFDPGNGKTPKEVIFDEPNVEASNAIKDELQAFVYAILNNTTPIVSIEDGTAALEVAHEILEKIKLNAPIL